MATTQDSSGTADRDDAAIVADRAARNVAATAAVHAGGNSAATAGAPAGRDLFLTEICESPSALLGTARTLGEQADKFERVRTLLGGRRLVLTGMGSSADAVTALASVLGRRGVEANTIHTAELLHYRMNALAPESAVVAVSQSGESVEAVRMAAELRKKEGVPLVAVTNGPQSPLAEEAAVSIDLGAGDERGPSSKTYVSTMLAMHVLAEVLTGGEPVASILSSAQALAEKAAAGLREWADGAEAIGRRLAAAIDESEQALMCSAAASPSQPPSSMRSSSRNPRTSPPIRWTPPNSGTAPSSWPPPASASCSSASNRPRRPWTRACAANSKRKARR